MSIDLILKPLCTGCGSTVELYGGTSNHWCFKEMSHFIRLLFRYMRGDLFCWNFSPFVVNIPLWFVNRETQKRRDTKSCTRIETRQHCRPRYLDILPDTLSYFTRHAGTSSRRIFLRLSEIFFSGISRHLCLLLLPLS